MSKRQKVKHFSYRSGMETSWRCPRAGYLEQHYLNTGIVKDPQAYWLSTGTAVHIGLAKFLDTAQLNSGCGETTAETYCIAEALDYWDKCGQDAVLSPYCFKEQRVLIEALLWAFYYHTLPTFLETYEVLYVEQEVTEIVKGRPTYMMMSRPDAIVRDRNTGELVVISWKTIDSVTDWRRLFFKQDLQGMMEAYYAEQFLMSKEAFESVAAHSVVWTEAPKISYVQTIYLVKGKRTKQGMEEGLTDQFADETIGDEWKQDSFLCYPFSNITTAHAENSLPCKHCWGEGCDNCKMSGAAAYTALEVLSWKWKYTKKGNVSQSALGPSFKKTLVTDTSMSVREWVKALHNREVFPCTNGNEEMPPLSKAVVWENPSYRDAGMMESVVRQVKLSEERRHRAKQTLQRIEMEQAVVDACSHPSDKVVLPNDTGRLFCQICWGSKHGDRWINEDAKTYPNSTHKELLDRNFPQQLTSCSFPWKCQFQDICHTPKGREALYNIELPVGYTPRIPHHSPELEGRQQ